MSEKGWLKVQCEKCGKIEVFRLTDEQERELRELGGVISLAFNHDDHVLVVAIDTNYDIRGQYVYKKAKAEISIPVSRIIENNRGKYDVEYLMAKASKWISFFLKEKDSKKAKVIGEIKESELEYIKKIAQGVKEIRESAQFDVITIERKMETKNIIVLITRKGDILASVIRNKVEEDVEGALRVLRSLISYQSN